MSTSSPAWNRVVLWTLASAALMYQLFESMISPALPLIQAGINADQASVAWVFTALLLSAAVSTPIVGRLADTHDKRNVFLGVMIVLLAGVAVSGLADSVLVLAIGQALQGVGLAMIPLILGIIRDTMHADVVARSNGFIIGMVSAGAVAGLLLAGVITSFLSYRFIFWIPFVILALITIVAFKVVPSCPPREGGRIDWTGASLLSVGLVTLLLSLNFAPAVGWTSPIVLGGIAFAVVLIVVFVAFELRSKNPMVDMRVGGRPVVIMYVFSFVVGYATIATYIAIPSIVGYPVATGYGLGSTPLMAGLMMVPLGIFGAISARLTAPLERWFGARIVILLSSAAVVVSCAVLVTAYANPTALAISSALTGFGLGLGLTQISNTVVATVPAERVVSVSGMSWVIKSVGGILGGQVSASILASDLIPTLGLPTWSAFTTVFIVAGIVAALALIATFALPRRTDIKEISLAPAAARTGV